MQSQPSVWETLVRSIVRFPAYALDWIVGLITVILSDLHVTTLAVTGVVVGLWGGSLLVGLVAFFVLYAVSRIVSNVANSIGFGLGNLAQANHGIAQSVHVVFGQPPTKGDPDA